MQFNPKITNVENSLHFEYQRNEINSETLSGAPRPETVLKKIDSHIGPTGNRIC